VKAAVHVAKVLLIDMRVDLGGRDIGVSEQFLDDAEIGSVAEKVGGEGMPQEVRVNIRLDPGHLRPLLHDLPDTGGGELLAAIG
jgi:hypothetical protein